MSENKSNTSNKKDKTYDNCEVIIDTKKAVLNECAKNGYPPIDVMAIKVEKAPEIGEKGEKPSITPQAIAELDPEKNKIRYVNGEEKAALGIEEAPTTEEIQAAKEAKKKAMEQQGPEI